MIQTPLHSWEVSAPEAIRIQRELRPRLVLNPCDIEKITHVAGADVSYEKGSGKLFAAVVVMEIATMEVVARSSVVDEARFPYVPGLLSFREAPAVLKAWERLDYQPDAVLLDGQGIAHPRRVGLASHVGLWLEIPSVGSAKSVLVGTYEEPGATAGSYTHLIDKDEAVGAALRTKERTNPIFVSPGHRVDLKSAVEIVMRCVRGYRLPEPIRQAHLYVNRLRRGEVDEGIKLGLGAKRRVTVKRDDA